MSRYRKYTDAYQAMLDALRIPLYYPQTSEAERKTLFVKQILKDKASATVVELRAHPHNNASLSENIIYNPAHYINHPYYSQGDFDGRILSMLFMANPNLQETISAALSDGDESMWGKVGFPYINDHGVHCCVAILRFGHEPDAQYTLVHIQNINDTLENRTVTLICSAQLAQDTYYTTLRGAHAEQMLNEEDMLQSVEEVIDSAPIYQLLQTVIGENGKISEEKLAHLDTRLKHHNLDNRDLFMHHIPDIMKNAEKLDSQIAKKIQRYYDKNTVNFFEPQRYKQLLIDLLSEAESKTPQNPEVILAFQDIYLEYLLIHLHQNDTNHQSIYLQDGIDPNILETIRTDITNGLPPILDVEKFVQKANQIYQNIDYKILLINMETNANIQEKSDLASIGKSKLPRLKQLNLAQLRPKQQKAVIRFTVALNHYIQSPNHMTYTHLRKLYPKLKLNPAELDKVQHSLELDNYKQALLLLKASIATNQHPYLKEEAEKKLRYLSSLPVDRISYKTLQFIETLNDFINHNLPATLQKLNDLYIQMELTPIREKTAANLLLSLNMARVQTQRLQGNHTWDPQGRVLVTILDSEHNNQPSTYSLDIHHHPEIENEYRRTLEKAVNFETSSHATNEILKWFYQNQARIYPLQQALQIYLNQLGQTFQKELEAAGVTDEILDQALLSTAQAINEDVIQCLVTGLIKASIDMGIMVPKLELQTVNQTLIQAQYPLRIKAQSILMNTLREKVKQSRSLPNSAMPNPAARTIDFKNKIVYFDTSESLVTSIETRQPDPSFSCHRINTYHGNETHFGISGVIHRLRVQSSGLNVPDWMTDTAYPTHFQNRFLQISATYRCQKSPPVTLYALAASNQQLKQMLNAAHHYNRDQHTQNLNHPMCFLQSYDMSEPGRVLGYPSIIDWSGTAELTIMHEMALCSQIAVIYPNERLDLDPYRSFLNPPSSMLSGLFKSKGLVSSPEGKQIRAQIENLKTNWQQNANQEPDLSMQQSVTKALQKLIAFDMHLDPQYGLLIQAMSLGITQQGLLSDASPGEVSALVLSHAHIFDLASLPRTIQEPFNMLLHATDKRTATVGASLLITAMQAYCQQHPNSAAAAMVPVVQQQTFAAQSASKSTNIRKAKKFLAESPQTRSLRMQKQADLKSSSQSSRKLNTHDQPSNMSPQSNRLFTLRHPKKIERSSKEITREYKKK